MILAGQLDVERLIVEASFRLTAIVAKEASAEDDGNQNHQSAETEQNVQLASLRFYRFRQPIGMKTGLEFGFLQCFAVLVTFSF